MNVDIFYPFGLSKSLVYVIQCYAAHQVSSLKKMGPVRK